MLLDLSTCVCAIYGTLLSMSLVVLYYCWKSPTLTLDMYFSSRNTRRRWSLGWSFFASTIGSWVLFIVPEISFVAGLWGILGYAIATSLPLLILALIGGYCWKSLDDGLTWSSYLLFRYGSLIQFMAVSIAVFFQYICVISELTYLSEVVDRISPETPKLVPILGVLCITYAYTIIDGLRGSLVTDVWQSIGVLILTGLLCGGMTYEAIVSPAQPRVPLSEQLAFNRAGFQVAITLCIAVTSSTIFFSGFWQRVYAAKNKVELRSGCYISFLLTIVYIGVLGISSVASNFVCEDDSMRGKPDLTMLCIAGQMQRFWNILLIVMSVALVTSSIDTIQNGLAAELVCLFKGRMTLSRARLFTAIINFLVIVCALQKWNILHMFLIADLLTTIAIGPMLLGYWPVATTDGAYYGMLSGVMALIVQGVWIHGWNMHLVWSHLLLEEGIYNASCMIAFILALVVPLVVTTMVSLLQQYLSRKT